MGAGKYGAWSSTYEEYRFFQSLVVAIICTVALLFDTCMHSLRSYIIRRHHAARLETDIGTFFVRLFNRMSSELMVLGFIAFCVWVMNRSGAFDAIVAALPAGGDACSGYVSSPASYSWPSPPPPYPPPAHGGGASHHVSTHGLGANRLSAEVPQAEDAMLGDSPADMLGAPSGAAYNDEECYHGPGTYNRPFGRKPFHYPPDGYALLAVVEDVHMQMFISMLFYFALITAYVSYVKTGCMRHSQWETEPSPPGGRAHSAVAGTGTEAPSQFRRMELPLATKSQFDVVREYFFDWTMSPAREEVEQRLSAAREGSGCDLSLSRLSTCITCQPAESQIPVPAPADFAGEAAELGGDSDAALAPIPVTLADFRFADYLAGCLSKQLDELVEFAWQTWMTVIIVALIEALLLYCGGEDVYIDLGFAVVTLGCLIMMWFYSYSLRRHVIDRAFNYKIAKLQHTGADVDLLEDHSAEVISGEGEVLFLRLLQALIWRNFFWAAVFFLNPQFRRWVKDADQFYEEDGIVRVLVVVGTVVTAVLLPYGTFNWALCMNLPPHIKYSNLDVLDELRDTPPAVQLRQASRHHSGARRRQRSGAVATMPPRSGNADGGGRPAATTMSMMH